MPHAPARDTVDELKTGNFNDPVAFRRIKACGFGINDDLAQRSGPF
jgi:hypothetical protein